MADIILVTGASRGIGAEIVRSLARNHPHRILLTSRRQEALLRVIADLEPESDPLESATGHHSHPRCIPFAADLATLDGIKAIGEAVRQALETQPGSRLKGIVNNAGYLIAKPFLELSEDDWDAHYHINLRAPALLIRELVPHLGDHAHIVNISSMGGFQGSSKFTGLSAYSATKGALSILSECLAMELGSVSSGRTISCNALCLGAVQTDMLEEAFPGFQAPVSAADMGNWIAEFVIRGGNFFNGQILPVTLADPVR